MVEKSIETHNLEVVVLCGGQGSRLGTFTSNMQKCMLEVNGKPFLTYIVSQLNSFGVHKFVFATGKGSKGVEDKFSDIGIISKEEKPLGTGGAIKNALKYIKNDHFMVVNGDSYCNLLQEDFNKFINKYDGNPLIMTTDIINCILSSKFETAKEHQFGTGFYIFPKSVFDNVPDKCSLEHDCLPSFSTKQFFILDDCRLLDIGTKENLETAKYWMRILKWKRDSQT